MSPGIAAWRYTKLKITKIETIPVSLPVGKFADGMDKVGGVNAPSAYYQPPKPKITKRVSADGHTLLSNVIVKIHTDEDIVGIGEAACDGKEPVEAVKYIIDREMAPHLIDRDPMDRDVLIDAVSGKTARGANRFSISGIDLALYDLAGKKLGVPVYTLLGGKRTDRLLASIEVPRGTPENTAAHCREYFDQGVRGIKLKVGSSPRQDAEALKAIREELGESVFLRADANGGYSVKQAVEFCSLVERYGVDLELLEQPVNTFDIDGMAAVRRSVSIPIEADESAYSLYQVLELIKHEAVDVINTKCGKAGGCLGVSKWAVVAESAGLPIVIGTEWGAGLKVAAKLHLGAAIKNVHPAVEFTEIMIHELLLKEPLRLEDGYLRVPDAPGLGMELDEDKIEAFRSQGFPE